MQRMFTWLSPSLLKEMSRADAGVTLEVAVAIGLHAATGAPGAPPPSLAPSQGDALRSPFRSRGGGNGYEAAALLPFATLPVPGNCVAPEVCLR